MSRRRRYPTLQSSSLALPSDPFLKVPKDGKHKTQRETLTLAKKFDNVHKNTTINNNVIPSVRRANPPNPSLSRILGPPFPPPPIVVVVPLEPVVMATDGARDSGCPKSDIATPVPAAMECDLRLDEEVLLWCV